MVIQQPKVRSYRDLRVWQAGMDLAEACYVLTKRFPKDELFGMTVQIRRAATSVPANMPTSPLEEARQFHLGENVASHGGVEFASRSGWAQIGFCVKRVEPDEIMVSFTGRGTGAAVAGS